jgi:leucyl/phenylalanyl-tRNA--protein transferase
MAAVRLDPEILLSAYSQGAFPMADRDGVVRWYSADPRGILPLDTFHVPRSLRQVVRSGRFEVHINRDFEATMRGCMSARRAQRGTWINEQLVGAYVRLHEMGFAHSVEAWRGGELAGGLYGVSLRGAFFGESMFHRQSDASKVALVHLVARLRQRGFGLLDTQASTEHLRQFGCIEIPAEQYLLRLHAALALDCTFA